MAVVNSLKSRYLQAFLLMWKKLLLTDGNIMIAITFVSEFTLLFPKAINYRHIVWEI